MCDCNIRYLIDGTKKLKNWKNDGIGDYLYMTCSNCQNYEEYFKDNFIECGNCSETYCNNCYSSLVYEVNTYDICKCNDSFVYHKCIGHYYCNTCALPDCELCNDDDNYQDKCPVCSKIYVRDNKKLCELHYEIYDDLCLDT